MPAFAKRHANPRTGSLEIAAFAHSSTFMSISDIAQRITFEWSKRFQLQHNKEDFCHDQDLGETG